MKRRLKYPLIVEGKYDKATLSNLVEGEILLTDGFHIYKNKEMLSLLRQLAQNGPVAVLTDSEAFPSGGTWPGPFLRSG